MNKSNFFFLLVFIQVIAVTDANGNTTRYGYDPNGRQITVTDALGNTITTSMRAFNPG